MSEESESAGIKKFRQRWQQLGRLKIHVEELDLDVYSNPWTLLDEEHLRAKGLSLDENEGVLWLIINKAQNEAGEMLFKPEDAPVLKRIAEAPLLKALAFRIVASNSDESPEKKSGATPTP